MQLCHPAAGFGQASLTAGCGGGGIGCVQWGVGLVTAPSCPLGLSACTYIYGEMWPAPGMGSRTLVVAVAPRGDRRHEHVVVRTAAGWSRSLSHLACPAGPWHVLGVGWVPGSGGGIVVLGSSGSAASSPGHGEPLAVGRVSRGCSPRPIIRAVPGFLAYRLALDPAYSDGVSVVIGFSVNSFAHDSGCLSYAPFYDVAA